MTESRTLVFSVLSHTRLASYEAMNTTLHTTTISLEPDSQESTIDSSIRISLITVSYNSADTIRHTIESVLSQTYKNIEYIIVDGNSQDGTPEIISEYESSFEGKLRWISEPDSGLYDAMNKGIRMATGDVIGILNSDDFYHKNTSLETIARGFSDKSTEVVFADIRFVKSANLDKTVRYYSSANFYPGRFRFGFMPAHPTFFTYRKNFDLFGYYRTDYFIAADYELLVRFLFVNKLKYKYLPVDLLKMRIGGRSTASVSAKLKFDSEIVRACRSNGLYTNTLLVLLRGFGKIAEFINTRNSIQPDHHKA